MIAIQAMKQKNVMKALSHDENDLEKDFHKRLITLNPTSSITKVVEPFL